MPTVTPISTYEVPEGDSVKCVGPANEMLVTRTDTKTITKYDISGGALTVMWRKPATPVMLRGDMFISPAGDIILLHQYGKTAWHYSADLELQSSHPVDGPMQLCAVSSNSLLYRHDHGGHATVDVYSMRGHQLIHTLNPPPGKMWPWLITMCVTETGDVVVADYNKTLDIFSHTGMTCIYTDYYQLLLDHKNRIILWTKPICSP